MKMIWTVALLVALAACSPASKPVECQPPEGGIGGTGAPYCAD